MNSIWRRVFTVVVLSSMATGCSERRAPRTQGDEFTTQNVTVHLGSFGPNAGPSGEEQGRDVASIQYSRVYQLAYLPDSADFASHEVEVLIYSNLAHVGTESISLLIDGKAGRVPLALNRHGAFTPS